jgi:hypothetical protein
MLRIAEIDGDALALAAGDRWAFSWDALGTILVDRCSESWLGER